MSETAPKSTVDVDDLRNRVMARMSQVIDPETGVDVIRMRLIEDLQIQNDGFVSFGTWAELEFVEDVELELEWHTNLVYTTIGNTNHTGKAKFSVEITDIFDFETSFLFMRTENPVPRADGTGRSLPYRAPREPIPQPAPRHRPR